MDIFGLFKGKKIDRNYTEQNLYSPFVIGGGKAISVTNKSSINLGVVFECIDVITRTITLISPKVIEQGPEGKSIANEHPVHRLINIEPYTLYDALKYRAQMIANYLLFGNAYALIIRNERTGQPIGLKVLEPGNVDPQIIEENGIEERWYKIVLKTGTIAVSQRDIIHMMDFNFDGVKGLSRIQIKKTTLQEGGQIQNYSEQAYTNGPTISGYIYGDRIVEKAALDYLRQQFENAANSRNGGIAALPHGFKYEPLRYNLPFADAQIIESKKFAVEDIARIFGVPLSLIGRGESADNKADREFNTFLATTIAPLAMIFESEHNRKLFTEKEKGKYYIKFELKGLYRTDMLTRYQAHQIALNHGFMNKDEIRDIEGMNPIDGGYGKTYFQMLNMIPLDMAEDYFENMINHNDTTENNNDITGI